MNNNYRRLRYSEQLRDPRWQKLRLAVFERDGWTCVVCGDQTATLHVHHRWYVRGAKPWEAPLESLATVCEDCHEFESCCRTAAEAELLQALKRKFFAHDLEMLSRLLGAAEKAPPDGRTYIGMAHFVGQLVKRRLHGKPTINDVKP